MDAGSQTSPEQAIAADVLARCRQRSLAIHAAIAGAWLTMLSALAVALPFMPAPWWIPAALLQGALIFGTTILLHEWVHQNILVAPAPLLDRVIGFLYALPTGISPQQYRIFHLDHHRHLGDAERDPKRAYLSPSRRSRLLKAAYFTILLFPIFFSAARRASAAYPAGIRARIGRQRLVALGIHALYLAAAWRIGGISAIAHAYLVPMGVAFPVCFGLNRLGQHYWIRPGDARTEGTRVDGNWAWSAVFLWSNFHLEHHYFPDVPCYRLRAINRALRPYYDRVDWPSRGYIQLLYRWLVVNEAPHAAWPERHRDQAIRR